MNNNNSFNVVDKNLVSDNDFLLLNNYKNISSNINEYLINYFTDNKENVEMNIINNDQVFEYLFNTLIQNDNLFSDVLNKIKI